LTLTPGQWSFTRWTTVGQLEALDVHHPLFSARVFLQGAHLSHYAPEGDRNWLWLSNQARFETGRAIRGGIPVCWPWFGVPDRNPPEVRRRIQTEAAHGYARTALWQVEDVRESGEEVEISLSLNATSDFTDVWDGRARLLLTFVFCEDSCQLALTTSNAGNEPLAITQALHTYLPVGDIERTSVEGLDGVDYVDTLEAWTIRQQSGPIRFAGETDRFYLSGRPVQLSSPHGRFGLRTTGSDSTVIWNPGPDKAASLSDFNPSDWTGMLCVEAANAASDFRALESGQSHTLGLMLGKK